MSKITINELPNEIIIKIVRLLDQLDLMNSALTCKRWRNLIESSCRWSLKQSLDDDLVTAQQCMEFMLTTNRRFEVIVLRRIAFDDGSKMLEVFRKHGFYVVRLVLDLCRFYSLIQFAEILNCMPNLEGLTIYHTITQCGANTNVLLDQNLPKMKKLKKLAMFCSTPCIVICVQKAKLTTIKLGLADPHIPNSQLFEDFLKCQEFITEFAVCKSLKPLFPLLFRPDNLDIQMPSIQLTKLSLTTDTFVNVHIMLKFLKSQANTLQELEIPRNFPECLLPFILNGMTALKALALRMDQIPEYEAFYKQLTDNQRIKTVTFLTSNIGACQFLTNFLEKLPNIRSLNLLGERCKIEKLRIMAKSLNKIESLTMRSLVDKWSQDLQFPNLKTFNVEVIQKPFPWNEFTKVHAKLTELTVLESRVHLNNYDIDQMTNSISLRSLRLGKCFTDDGERFFEIIRKNCPNLKALDLHKSCIPTKLKGHMNYDGWRLCDDFKLSTHFTFRWPESWRSESYHFL